MFSFFRKRSPIGIIPRGGPVGRIPVAPVSGPIGIRPAPPYGVVPPSQFEPYPFAVGVGIPISHLPSYAPGNNHIVSGINNLPSADPHFQRLPNYVGARE